MEFKGITEWMATNLSDAESSEFSSEDDSAYHSELFSVEDKRPTEELDFEFGKPVSEILNFELSEKDKEMRRGGRKKYFVHAKQGKKKRQNKN